LENYYEVLGVSETATQEEIKKAFRTKSKESHPDRGGNEEEFKRINEAYSNLSDNDKKAQYDAQRNNPFGGDPFDMFSQFFNQRQHVRKAPDRIMDLNIGAVDSFVGKKINVSFTRKTNCNPCNGQGGDRINCNTCGGTGHVTQVIGNSFFQNIIQSQCNSCMGRGFTFSKVCNTCYGDGRVDEPMSIDINLPVGISDGQLIKASSMGDYSNGLFGDLIFKIIVTQQDGFEKVASDLIYNKFMSVDELNQDELILPHPNGEISVKLPEVIDTSVPLRIKGKGYPNENGDFYVRLYVKHNRFTNKQ